MGFEPALAFVVDRPLFRCTATFTLNLNGSKIILRVTFSLKV